MFCSKCGANNSEKAKFCEQCGNPLSPSTSSRSQQKTISFGTAFLDAFLGRKPVHVKKPIFLVALSVVGLIFLIYFVRYLSKTDDSDKSASALFSVPTKKRINIISGSFVVQPAHYHYYPILIPGNSHNAKLMGRFTVSGGWGNDIEAFVTDQDGFVNFQNHHQISPYFNSGKVTTKTLLVPLDPGSYYLVFSNVFSLVSNKAITGQIDLEYEE